MRLDHLLSREYKKKDRRDHGAGSGKIESERAREMKYCIVLSVLERGTFRARRKDEGRDTVGV